MGKYLKKFTQHADYVTYIDGTTPDAPRVSMCDFVIDKHIHYNKELVGVDKYLTTIALEDGTISFNIWYSMGTDYITSISYSTDDGQTWTTTNNTNNKQSNLAISVNVEEGDEILWKGIATQTGYYDRDDVDDGVGSFFSADCGFDVSGNIMSLLYGDDFLEQDGLGNADYIFTQLFSDYDGIEQTPIRSAENLVLPSTTLSDNCYNGMFRRCTSLTTAPALPATTLSNYCYNSMFSHCTSLTTAPALPATTLGSNCYQSMFYNCTSLTTAPALPATTLSFACYTYMFYGCTSLTTAPALPATTLSNYCYNGMFYGCTSLTTAPALPATTVFSNSYYRMFYGCTSLTTAPSLPATTVGSECYREMFWGCINLTTAPYILPATTLVYNCYYGMFLGCTSLTTAPVLPATTLTMGCYSMMFYGCHRLNYIKALFTTTPSSSYTGSWVVSVSSTGTFVKSSEATWTTTGYNGIPTGWTVNTSGLFLYEDDFPYEDEFEDALESEMNGGNGVNRYQYTGETMTFEGQTCYVWKMPGSWSYSDSDMYLLTDTIDIDTLYAQSLEDDVNNTFDSLVAYGTMDNLYTNRPDHKLVKIWGSI